MQQIIEVHFLLEISWLGFLLYNIPYYYIICDIKWLEWWI